MQPSVTTNVIAPAPGLPGGGAHCATGARSRQAGSTAWSGLVDRREMQARRARGTILQVAAEREGDARKCDLRPWNFRLSAQAHVEAFDANSIRGLGEHGAEHHMHLPRMQHMNDRYDAADLDARQRLFPALAGSRLLQGLAVLHEAGRNRPEPAARLDPPPAKQDPTIMLRHTAGDQFRILVMDGPAGGANMPRQVVTVRDAHDDARPAIWTKVHGPDCGGRDRCWQAQPGGAPPPPALY